MLVVGFSGGVLTPSAAVDEVRSSKQRARCARPPRYVVGWGNLTEFSVAFATSATWSRQRSKSANLAPVIPLVFGPLRQRPVRRLPGQDPIEPRAMLIMGSKLSQAKNFAQSMVTSAREPNEM